MYNEVACGPEKWNPTEAGRESTENKLQRRRKQLMEELQAVEAAIELFAKHPEIPGALDLLGQIRF